MTLGGLITTEVRGVLRVINRKDAFGVRALRLRRRSRSRSPPVSDRRRVGRVSAASLTGEGKINRTEKKLEVTDSLGNNLVIKLVYKGGFDVCHFRGNARSCSP